MGDIKYELQSIKHLDDYINSLLRDKEETYERLNSSTPSGDRVQNSNISTTDSILIKLDEIDHKINKHVDELVNKKMKLLGLMELINSQYRVVLHLKYFRFLTLDEVASKLSYSRRQVDRFHGEGLLELNKRWREMA